LTWTAAAAVQVPASARGGRGLPVLSQRGIGAVMHPTYAAAPPRSTRGGTCDQPRASKASDHSRRTI